MELIIILIVAALICYLAYSSFKPKLDANKDGKVDAAEVKAAVKQAEVKVEAAVKKTVAKTKTAVKKATTRTRAK